MSARLYNHPRNLDKEAKPIVLPVLKKWTEEKGTIIQLHEAIMEAFNPPSDKLRLKMSFKDANDAVRKGIKAWKSKKEEWRKLREKFTSDFMKQNDTKVVPEDASEKWFEENPSPSFEDELVSRLVTIVDNTNQDYVTAVRTMIAQVYNDSEDISFGEFQDRIVSAFFPTGDDAPIDKWVYYEEVDDFIRDNRDRLFPWINKEEFDGYGSIVSDPIFDFHVTTRKCSVEIQKILDAAAVAYMLFDDIIASVDSLFFENPVLYSMANSTFCHEAVWYYIREHIDQFPHLKRDVEGEFEDVYKEGPNYSFFSRRGNKAAHHFVKLAEYGDLPEKICTDIMIHLREQPETGEIGDTACRDAICGSIDKWRKKHGSNEEPFSNYAMLGRSLAKLGGEQADSSDDDEDAYYYSRRYRVERKNTKRSRKN